MNIDTKYIEQKQLVKRSMNKYEWTRELDNVLMQSVIRNYFNFQVVSLELNQEARNLGLDFGATNIFTNEKCRIRWSYLHLQRKLGKPIAYKALSRTGTASEGELNKENTNLENVHRGASKEATGRPPMPVSESSGGKNAPKASGLRDPGARDAKQLLDAKDIRSLTERRAPKTMAEIEANMWKHNIKAGQRRHKDFLDTSTEDFSQNKSRGIDGQEITPSSFNIFRDSLRDASDRLLETLNDNLPDMNLQEIEESESEREANGSGDDEDVLPLDFRTALVEKDNKVVIQAKPLQFRTDFDDEAKRKNDTGGAAGPRSGPSLDAYLEMVRKEAFKEDEGAIMLDPDINIKEKFDQIDLPCNEENRINNTIGAPLRPDQSYDQQQIPTNGEPSKKRGPRGPKSHKTYDTDTDTNPASASEHEDSKPSHQTLAQKSQVPGESKSLEQAQRSQISSAAKKLDATDDPFSFEHSLKAVGLDGIDELLGEEENAQEAADHLKQGIVGQITRENREAAMKQEEDAALARFSNGDLMAGLQDAAGVGAEADGPTTQPQVAQGGGEPDHTEESDAAPVSPYADGLTAQEEAQLQEAEQKKQFLKAVQAVSSASETDEAASGCESAGRKAQKLARARPQQTSSTLAPVKEASSSSAKQGKKVRFYKGMPVMSDTEEVGGAPARPSPQKPAASKTRDQEKGDPEASGSSESSGGGADEFFNQQRDAIRRKLASLKAGQDPNPTQLDHPTTTTIHSQEQSAKPREDAKSHGEQQIILDDQAHLEASEGEEDESVARERRLEEERRAEQELIERKKAEAEERMRREQLKKQREAMQADQERKRKDKEDLMQKLKKQDEERKRRKREEKERKEREHRRYQAMLEEQKRLEEEEKERELEAQREIQERKDREKRLQEEQERRKAECERMIMSEESWNEHGKPDVPCLFDKKCAYMSKLHSVPLDLERKIQTNQVEQEDLVSQRYRALMIPLGDHMNNEILSRLIQYFLLHSTLHKVYEGERKSLAFTKKSFPFKCISMQITVTKAPLSKPSLQPLIESMDRKGHENAIRVLSLLFDTQDEPKTNAENFSDILKQCKLSSLLEARQLDYIEENYASFLQKLAFKYFRQNQIREFPFEIESANAHMIRFAEEADTMVQSSTANLSHIAFLAEYTRPDDETPTSPKIAADQSHNDTAKQQIISSRQSEEAKSPDIIGSQEQQEQQEDQAAGNTADQSQSWELFRRCPSFYAFNPNKPGYTKIDPTKKRVNKKITTKNNVHQFENVCVVFKDMSFDPIVECKAENSLAYFIDKACLKNGLDICGLRLAYLDDKQRGEYYQLFHERVELSSTWEKPVLAMVLRGLDAATKVESILGHFNPEMARRTGQKSLRACFGRSKVDNCVMQIFDQSKKHLDTKFWFGGRVQTDKFVINQYGIQPEQKQNQLQMIVPCRIEKHLLMLSPCLPSTTLPVILQRLAMLGVTLLDIQKLDFSKLQYMSGNIGNLNREAFVPLRGRQFKTEVGYVLRLARENLRSHFLCQTKNFYKDLEGFLEEHTVDQLLFLTSGQDEYKKVWHLLKRGPLKPRYVPLTSPQKAAKVKDSQSSKGDSWNVTEDPAEYKDIILFNGGNAMKSAGARRTNIKPLKGKADLVAMEEKFSVSTCVCFIKISSFKKQLIGDTLHAILNLLELELLGLKVMHAKKELSREHIPQEVQKTLKCIAYKFHELSTESKLRTKLIEFETLALILRGQNVQGQIDTIYDREKLKFKPDLLPGLDDLSFKATPHVVFVTNEQTKQPLIDFLLETQYINLFQEMSEDYSHLKNSVDYHNRVVQPYVVNSTDDVVASRFIRIQRQADLVASSGPDGVAQLAPCVASCVIKPNQPFKVILRALKSIANLNPDGLGHRDPNYLRISKIEYVPQYSQDQMDLLYDHDVVFDDHLAPRFKKNQKFTHQELFEGRPAVQVQIEGKNALAKLKALIGPRDPAKGNDRTASQSEKDTLRSFYGVDRLDNAFFVSDTVHEAQIEDGVLFGQTCNSDAKIDPRQTWQVSSIEDKAKITSESMEITPVSQILRQNQVELALIVISPALVMNNDFAFVMDEFYRSKFNICALKKKQIDKPALQVLFQDLVPRVHHVDILHAEFRRGESVFLVVEKTKALEDAQELIGKFGIKTGSDYEKKKRKTQLGFQFTNRQGLGAESSGLIQEYGSYIFCFPNVELNKEKILREFRALPNSKHFKLERVT